LEIEALDFIICFLRRFVRGNLAFNPVTESPENAYKYQNSYNAGVEEKTKKVK